MMAERAVLMSHAGKLIDPDRHLHRALQGFGQRLPTRTN
jgi:hypothetical protein